jgi:hypothetical protein
MSIPLLTDLEALAAQLVQRRWVVRAGLVDDSGRVTTVCTSHSAPETEAAGADAREPLPRDAEATARLVVERVEDQTWIYVDVRGMRLLARLSRASYAGAATAWLVRELGRIGFTVERETLAQD